MTIGDILGIIAGVTTICLSTWALLLSGTLLFARRAAAAQAHLETAPLRVLGVGVIFVALIGTGGFALLNQPNGLMKLLGWALLMARLAGERVSRLDARFSTFGALTRGTGLLVIAGVVPLLGWFIVTPLMIIVSLGAGFHALFSRRRTAPVTEQDRSLATAAPREEAVVPTSLEAA